MTQPSTDLTPGQLDALYQPFPPFERWASTGLDAALWDDFLARFEAVQHAMSEEDLEAALDMVVRAAAFDTGAIEGLYETNRGITYSVAVQSAAWETELARSGAQTGAYFAAQLAAYELILDAATRRIPVVEAWLRGLHAEITAAQSGYQVLTSAGWQTHVLPRGEYKREPNHVRTASGRWHAFAPVKDTAAEVRRLTTELAAAEFTAAHPAVQAAYAHYALVSIHPFADGNGRLARALSSVYLYRAARIPLLVYADQRLDYYRALAAADNGDHGPFVDFVFDRGLDALAILTDQLRATRATRAAEQPVGRLHTSHREPDGLSDSDVQAVGHRVAERLRTDIQRILADADLPPGTTVEFGGAGRATAPFEDLAYHRLAERGSFALRLGSRCFRSRVESEVHVGVAADRKARFTFCVVDHVVGDESRASPPLRLRLSDVHPELSRVAAERMTGWCALLVDSRLGELGNGGEVGNRVETSRRRADLPGPDQRHA